MQHSNKTKTYRAIWLFPFYSGFRVFALLFRRMLCANTTRNSLKEGDLKPRRPKKATFMTARHKQERLRLAYNPNVLDWPAEYLGVSPGFKLSTTFLNIANYGEITTTFQLPEPQRNRTRTANFVNLILTSTVHSSMINGEKKITREIQHTKA